MKNGMKRLLALTLIAAMSIATLAGCGARKPKAEDASNYVKAFLDVNCKGTYNQNVKIVGRDPAQRVGYREQVVQSALETLGADGILSDATLARFSDFIYAAFGKAKYTVGQAVETSDGGYDVSVTIEPLMAFAVLNENYEDRLWDKIYEDYELILQMSEQEMNDYIMGLLIDMFMEDLEDPQYEEPKVVTVHYGIVDSENKVYGIPDEDEQKLIDSLFSDYGL